MVESYKTDLLKKSLPSGVTKRLKQEEGFRESRVSLITKVS